MRPISLILCLSLASSLFAHDLYIFPNTFHVTPGSKLQVGLHNGDLFPQSEASPVLARVRNAKLLSSTTATGISDLQIVDKRAVGTVDVPPTQGTMILSVETVPNFISLDPKKFVDYLTEEGLRHVIDWRAQHSESNKPSRERYSKFAKALIVSGTADDFYKHSLGFPIEIIPEANPATIRPGAGLPVRVLFHGKPAVALQLESAWSDGKKAKTTVIGRTDQNGRIRVPITGAGKWRLHSLLMERCSDPAAADWESYWASFTFEVR